MENFSQFYFYFCSDFGIEVYLLKWKMEKKSTGEVTEKSEICQSNNAGTMRNYCAVSNETFNCGVLL